MAGPQGLLAENMVDQFVEKILTMPKKAPDIAEKLLSMALSINI